MAMGLEGTIQPGIDFLQEFFGFENYMRWLDCLKTLEMTNSRQLVTWLLDTTESQLEEGRKQHSRIKMQQRKKVQTENELISSCIQAFYCHSTQAGDSKLEQVIVKAEVEDDNDTECSLTIYEVPTEHACGKQKEAVERSQKIRKSGSTHSKIDLNESESCIGESEDYYGDVYQAEPVEDGLDENVPDLSGIQTSSQAVEKTSSKRIRVRVRKSKEKKEKSGRFYHSSGTLCPVCGTKFKQEAHLRTHMVVHDRSLLKPCTICEKGFGTLASLREHYRVHHPVILTEKCPLCSECFQTQESLKKHKEKVHPNNTPAALPYKCGLCNQACRTRTALRAHRLAEHQDVASPTARMNAGRKPTEDTDGPPQSTRFMCEYCDKKFHSRQNLAIHVSAHFGLRPFKCGRCDMAFRQAFHLKSHEEAIHDKLKRHICEFCNRAFGYRTNYLQHLQIHRRKDGELIPLRKKLPVPKFRRNQRGQCDPIMLPGLENTEAYVVVEHEGSMNNEREVRKTMGNSSGSEIQTVMVPLEALQVQELL